MDRQTNKRSVFCKGERKTEMWLCFVPWYGKCIHMTAAGKGIMTMLAIVFVVVYSKS
jgi:hypothetical protein